MTFAEHKANLPLLAEDENISEIQKSYYINEAVRSVYQRRLWNFLITSTTMSTVADQGNYDGTDGLPTDIRKVYSVIVDDVEYGYCPYMETLGYEDSLSNMYTINPSATTLTLFDTPDTNGTNNITFVYYKVPDPLINDGDSVEFSSQFHVVIDYFAVAEYFNREGDLNEASKWEAKAENVMADLEAEDMQQMSGKHYLYVRSA